MNRLVCALLVLSLLIAPAASAEELPLALRFGELKITVATEGGSARIDVEGDPQLALNTLALEGPSRAVLDLPPQKAARNKNYDIRKSAVVQSVRIGTHADKLRIVVDLAFPGAPEVHVERGKAIRILLAPAGVETAAPPEPSTEDGTIVEDMPPAESPVAAPSPEHTPTQIPAMDTAAPTAAPSVPATATPTPSFTATPLAPTPTATATASPTATDTASPSATPSATATTAAPAETDAATEPTEPPEPEPSLPEEIAPADVLPAPTATVIAVPQLRSFSFDYEGDERTPLIRLQLTQRMEFKLTKIDVNLYAIEIPDTTLSTETLSLPQFPPHDFVGFTYIEGAKTTGGAVVRIGVERGARINAFAQGSDIVVRMAQ